MKELIIIVLSSILLVLNIFILFSIALEVEEDNVKCCVLIGIKEFISKLFYNKNLFGIILNLLIIIMSAPAIILILIVQVFIWIYGVFVYIYNLGNKKTR